MQQEYYKNKSSVEEYIELAKDVSGAQLIEKLEQVLPTDSTILEIGSGPGTDWKILNQTFNVIGSDNSPAFLDHLRSENPKETFLEIDAVNIDTDQKFDGIYSNKVLHHLQTNELKASIKRQYEVLKPNGIVCHSFWQGEGSEIFKGMFVNYHTRSELEAFFDDYFDLLTIEPYAEFEDNDSLLLIGRKS